MSDNYFSIVTDLGTKKMLEAMKHGKKLNITHFAVGDGGGAYFEPSADITQLKNEIWRGTINSCEISKEENILIIGAVIPFDVGDFTIREMGIIDEDGVLIAVCNTPDTQKVTISDGVVHELSLFMELALSNADVVQLLVDTNIVTATKKDLESKVDKVEGKGLSTNDYTNADKNKLSGIAEGAEVNVQADWNITDSNSDAYIKNKPQAIKNPNVLNISLNGVFQGAYDGSSQKNVNITAENVGADSSGTATTKVSEHNASEKAHADIRNLVTTLANKLNTLADSDDTTLDQLSEIVAYIKNNKSLIDGITTNKVNVSDIIDNLTSNVTNKPLSAKQGKVLKDLIDTLTSVVDGKVSKSGDTMTGDLGIPVGRANINRSVPVSGRLDSVLIPQGLSEIKTFIGSVSDEKGVFWNIISTRHGNGHQDGNLYGMYLRSLLTDTGSHGGSLLWNKQMGSGNGWLGERVLLDSANYKNYCTPENIGLGNVNNTPDYLKHVEAATYLTGWGDTRNVETTPNTYSEKFKVVGLKTAVASKITTGSSFATLVGIRGWSDSTAGKAHELAFDGNGKLLHRVGLTSWEGWREIAHIDDLTPQNIGALSLNGGHMASDSYIDFEEENYSDGGFRQKSVVNKLGIYIESADYEEDSTENLEEYNHVSTNVTSEGIKITSHSRNQYLNMKYNTIQSDKSVFVSPQQTARPFEFAYTYFARNGDDGKTSLGTSSMRWKELYASNGTIQTSDRAKKTNINGLEIQKVQAFINGLNPVSYKMIDGTSGRTHYGFIAQDVEELMNQLNINNSDFAGFIKSPKKIIKYEDENGKKLENPIEEVIENEYDYALRYDEFIAPLIKVVQEQQKTIEQQQIAIENQQKEIEQIKKDILKIYSSI